MKQVVIKVWILFFLLGILGFPDQVIAFSGQGSGTSNAPYQITTCAQLQEMEDALSSFYQVQNDINCNGFSYTPIETFTGTLNGQNKTISNLTIGNGTDYIGLFSSTDTGAVITNVRLVNVSISSTDDTAGGLIGWAGQTVTISNSSVQGSISGDTYAAGLVGVANQGATISNSYFNGTLSLNDTGYMGGLVGIFNTQTGTITNSYSSGTYSATNSPYGIGGLVGITNSGTSNISNSYSSASMNVTDGDYFGGLVGITNGGTVSLTNVFSAATLNPTGTPIGGVVGYDNGSTITSSGSYFDQTLAGTASCTSSGTVSCTAVNASSSNPTYFKSNNINPPLNSWDFNSIWLTYADEYPRLRTFNPVSQPALTTPSGNGQSTPTCNDATPVGIPEITGFTATGNSITVNFSPTTVQTKGYTISYGWTKDANQYTDTFDVESSSGVNSRAIGSLAANTTYYFKIQSRNGCNAGAWSQIVPVKTSGKTTTMSGPGTAVLGVSTISGCTYQVQSGDSLWIIASKKWGSGAKYSQITNLNPGFSSTLSIGQTLKLCN